MKNVQCFDGNTFINIELNRQNKSILMHDQNTFFKKSSSSIHDQTRKLCHLRKSVQFFENILLPDRVNCRTLYAVNVKDLLRLQHMDINLI